MIQSCMQYVYQGISFIVRELSRNCPHRHPATFNRHTNEYTEHGEELPMFVWWDQEHYAGRNVPESHVPLGSLLREDYVQKSLDDVERARRIQYIQMVERNCLTLNEANERIERWHDLRRRLLDNEASAGETIEILSNHSVCGICFEDKACVELLQCRHTICDTCFNKIRSISDVSICPYCRSDISTYRYDGEVYLI